MDNMEMTIIGSLGRDVDERYTPTGKLVGNFSVAVEKGFGDNKHTEWVECTMWANGDKLLFGEWAVKGTKALLRGTPRIKTWTPRDGGEKRFGMELTVNYWRILGGGKPKEDAEPSPYDGEAE